MPLLAPRISLCPVWLGDCLGEDGAIVRREEGMRLGINFEARSREKSPQRRPRQAGRRECRADRTFCFSHITSFQRWCQRSLGNSRLWSDTFDEHSAFVTPSHPFGLMMNSVLKTESRLSLCLTEVCVTVARGRPRSPVGSRWTKCAGAVLFPCVCCPVP